MMFYLTELIRPRTLRKLAKTSSCVDFLILFRIWLETFLRFKERFVTMTQHDPMTQTLCLSYSLLHLLNPPFTIKGQKGGKFSCHFLFTEKLLGFLLVTDKKIWNWHYKVRLLAIIHKFSISRKHQPGYVLQNFRHSYFFVSFAKFRKPWFF